MNPYLFQRTSTIGSMVYTILNVCCRSRTNGGILVNLLELNVCFIQKLMNVTIGMSLVLTKKGFIAFSVTHYIYRESWLKFISIKPICTMVD